jgi:predicted dinucleotide-binding enzyme
MRIGIIGPGRIGGNVARQAVKAGHEVMLSFSRDADRLAARARELGASTGSPAEAVAFAEVVVLAVPWRTIDEALEAAGPLDGKVVIDTTNQFGPGGVLELPGGRTAAQHNAERMLGARYTKSFNTLTAAFQAEAAKREGDERVVQWLCGDDADAKATVARLLDDMGYVPVDLGGTATCQVMEAPRRQGAVYGEEYRAPDAQAVVDALRAGVPIAPPPSHTT